MSQFNPTIRIVSPDDHPDLLAGAVLNSLSRPIYYPLSWGIAQSFLLALITAGIAPIMIVARWMRGLTAQHAQQLWYLGEWLRLQTGDPQAAKMQEAAKKIRFSWGFAILAWLFALGAIVAIAMQYVWNTPNPRTFIHSIYGFPNSPELIALSCAISAAAVLNWLHLAWHARNVRQCLECFNELARKYGMNEVPPPQVSFGLRPLWVIGGLIMASSGAFWGLPAMLAAAAHRRYTIVASARMRGMLAENVRTLLRQRRPAVRIPAPIKPTDLCVRPNCRAPLVSVANFCSRCGTRVANLVDVVA